MASWKPGRGSEREQPCLHLACGPYRNVRPWISIAPKLPSLWYSAALANHHRGIYKDQELENHKATG